MFHHKLRHFGRGVDILQHKARGASIEVGFPCRWTKWSAYCRRPRQTRCCGWWKMWRLAKLLLHESSGLCSACRAAKRVSDLPRDEDIEAALLPLRDGLTLRIVDEIQALGQKDVSPCLALPQERRRAPKRRLPCASSWAINAANCDDAALTKVSRVRMGSRCERIHRSDGEGHADRARPGHSCACGSCQARWEGLSLLRTSAARPWRLPGG